MNALHRVTLILVSVALLAGGHVSGGDAAASNPSSFPRSAVPPEGGSVFICVASGLLFGAAVLSGNALAAAGAALGAIKHGCL